MNPTDPQLFNGLFQVNGATRLYGTIGDPIRQLRMTGVMSQVFAATGVNAVWLPFEGGPDLLPLMLDALAKMRNLGGFTVTIPHKTAMLDLVGRATPRAMAAGSVNLVRRDPDGGVWIRVTDELDPEILSARINGQWTWAYLDLKAELVRVDAAGATGELVLVVGDEVGNRTTFIHTL